jgi:hypothetical protein
MNERSAVRSRNWSFLFDLLKQEFLLFWHDNFERLVCLFWGAPEKQQQQGSIRAVQECYQILG